MRVGVAFGLAALAGFLATSAHASGRPDLDAVLARWDRDEHPDLRGVVVVRDGRRVAERYYNGASPSELHDIRSAGKSITALLVGIAIDRGAIASVDDPVSKYWPEASGSAIGAVPLRDVVSMRSGLAAFDEDPASSGNEDRMDASDNPMAFVRHIPSAEAPGTRYRYNSATAYTAGVVVAKATGETMSSFARARLFRPLGITRWDWQSDASGMTKGQGNLSLTTRELASIGEMVRNNGRFQGRQIVSAHWIAAMLAPHVSIGADDPYADQYGYFWYGKVQHVAGKALPVSFASGNGGNKIYVIPACHLVVAITSSAYGHGYGQRRSETILRGVLATEVQAGECQTSGSR
ncbi:serine hydrolase [Sphingomonas sp. NFR15]|uniref:serine hydrolase domain-containing protein n=1 Tax=Sphingomonas sp. NFR15 TaxID=1566282 RepID=UPI000B810C0F|nr:serine hydrolase domain-containing protein [Sphingomonas sp. NFR15]